MYKILLLTALTCYADQEHVSDDIQTVKTQTKSNKWLYTGTVITGAAAIVCGVWLWKGSDKLDQDAYKFSKQAKVTFDDNSIALGSSEPYIFGAAVFVSSETDFKKSLGTTSEEYTQKLRKGLTVQNLRLTKEIYSKDDNWQNEYNDTLSYKDISPNASALFLIATCFMHMIKQDLEEKALKIQKIKASHDGDAPIYYEKKFS